MATTNLGQFREKILQPEALYAQVLYQRSLMGLGTIPSDWDFGKMYESAKKDILELSFDDLQLVQSTLCQTVDRTFGITYHQEEVKIRPFVVKMVESEWQEGDFEKAIPMAITELNQALDAFSWAQLKEKATVGSAYAWAGPADFISWVLSLLADPMLCDLRKHLILPEKIKAQLLSHIINPEHRSWYAALTNRLAEVNCDAICAKAADQVLLVVEPFLIEYTGMEPHVYKTGINDEDDYRWIRLGMSNTDYSLRNPLGLQRFEITGFDEYFVRQSTQKEDRKTKKDQLRISNI